MMERKKIHLLTGLKHSNEIRWSPVQETAIVWRNYVEFYKLLQQTRMFYRWHINFDPITGNNLNRNGKLGKGSNNATRYLVCGCTAVMGNIINTVNKDLV